MRTVLVLAILAISACSSLGGPYPSLQPRAAEAIDPRVPVERPINDRPVRPALAAQLAELVASADRGESDFQTLAGRAEQLASHAGAPRTEGWIAAQQALSAAMAARQPVTQALADIDAIGAKALQSQGGIAPNDLAAIQKAAATVAGLDQQQVDRIDAIKRQLGI